MNNILSYVLKNGNFDVSQTKDGYKDIPFNHREYCDYTQQLYNKLINHAVDRSKYDVGIEIKIMIFQEGGETFVLRFLAMGEYIYSLMTLDYYVKNFKEIDDA